MGSATISELDYRLLQAQLDIMRGELPIEDGFTPPLVYGLSADRQKVVVRILVFPKQLPAKYDDRRSAMLARGMLCTRSVLSWFHGGGISDSDVTVEFLDTDDSGKEKMLATYQGGQLAFH
jgi:hypothetical protein